MRPVSVLIYPKEKVKGSSFSKPAVVLESTGHYHRGLVAVLQKKGYEVITLNPLFLNGHVNSN